MYPKQEIVSEPNEIIYKFTKKALDTPISARPL
jgi:hypothetical protein